MNVIPYPQNVDIEPGFLDVSAGIALRGEMPIADWFESQLEHLASPISNSTSGVSVNFTLQPIETGLAPTIGVRADGGDPAEESHEIAVSAEGIQITGPTQEALFRGATTLLHLLMNAPDGIPLGTILDAPRFAWRGLSLDVVRCFHPVSTVKRVIDLLALYKFNVLHVHLTDTEGWRFPVPQWPLLTEISGLTARDGRPGQPYSAEEFTEIVQYAADRFITVVPEFDSPGHTASVLAAYPELASDEIRAMDPAMHYLHPAEERVPELLRDVYVAMAHATPVSRYIHIGGDEAIAMDHATFQQYIQMALPIARETGKGIVAWQEAARGGLAEGDILQHWIPEYLIERIRQAGETGDFGGRSADDPVVKAFIELFKIADKDIPQGLGQGANILLSPATQFYLDTRYIEESINPADNTLRERLGLPQSVYGQGTTRESYDFEPLDLLQEVPSERIVGLECAIWCETITSADDLFFQLLPRLAGVGEKAWSSRQDWADYADRLQHHSAIWDAMGLRWFASRDVWS